MYTREMFLNVLLSKQSGLLISVSQCMNSRCFFFQFSYFSKLVNILKISDFKLPKNNLILYFSFFLATLLLYSTCKCSSISLKQSFNKVELSRINSSG